MLYDEHDTLNRRDAIRGTGAITIASLLAGIAGKIGRRKRLPSGARSKSQIAADNQFSLINKIEVVGCYASR